MCAAPDGVRGRLEQLTLCRPADRIEVSVADLRLGREALAHDAREALRIVEGIGGADELSLLLGGQRN